MLSEEVPIGCVIVYEDKIIGRGYNRRNTLTRITLAHAELTAIRKASRKMGDWRTGRVHAVCDPGALPDVCRSHRPVPDGPGGDRLYEPQSGLRRLYPESAADGQSLTIRRRLTTGVLEEECSQMMKTVFPGIAGEKKEGRMNHV